MPRPPPVMAAAFPSSLPIAQYLPCGKMPESKRAQRFGSYRALIAQNRANGIDAPSLTQRPSPPRSLGLTVRIGEDEFPDVSRGRETAYLAVGLGEPQAAVGTGRDESRHRLFRRRERRELPLRCHAIDQLRTNHRDPEIFVGARRDSERAPPRGQDERKIEDAGRDCANFV